MTHMGPMSESEGEFTHTETAGECRQCGSNDVICQKWESNDGAFEDYKFTCQNCGHRWWVDGPDA